MAPETQPAAPTILERYVAKEALEWTASTFVRTVVGGGLKVFVGAGLDILKGCYESDWELWHKYNRKDDTLDRLSDLLAEKGVSWSDVKLYRAVRAAEQSVKLNEFRKWPSLSVEHVCAVQGLDWNTQVDLFELVEKDRLSSRDLIRKVAEIRREKEPRSEMRAGATGRSMLRKFDRLLDERHELATVLGEAGLPAEQIAALAAALEPVHAQVEALQQLLQPVRAAKATENVASPA